MKRLLVCALALAASCAGTPPATDGVSEVRSSSAPLELIDMAGERHALDDVLASGETVALVFWQSW